MNELFSKRMGINILAQQIKIRYEAPLELRNYLLLLMEQYFRVKDNPQNSLLCDKRKSRSE